MECSLQFHTAEYSSRALRQMQKVGWCFAKNPFCERQNDYPVVLFLHGMKSDFTGWWSNTKFAAAAMQYPALYVFANSEPHGWYTDGINSGLKCEQDIVDDLVPWVRTNIAADQACSGWAIAGQSMGGYGAIKLALKYPELFRHALAFSGAFNVTRNPEPHPVFGDPVNDRALRRANDLYSLAEEALCRFPTDRPQISFNCGTEDPFLEASRAFHQHLQFIGYGHTYWEEKGQHTWPYWNRALKRALPRLFAQMSPKPGGLV